MLILRNARTYDGAAVDVVIDSGRISEVVPAGTATTDGESVDLEGRWMGPGLWDGHVHFAQWVIRRSRVDLTGTTAAADALAVVRDALAAAAPLQEGMLVGYGFRDALWADSPSLAALDALAPDIPVVLVSGDLHCAWMNRRGAERLGLSPDATGVVREGDWIGVSQRMPGRSTPDYELVRDATQAAAQRGVVGVVDFENTDLLSRWPELVAAGADQLRIEASVWPDRLEAAIAAGRRSGDALDDAGLVRVGPLKVVVDGSLNTRTAWCWDPYPGFDPHARHACGVEGVSPARLRELLVRARDAGLAAAVHAIGDRAGTEVLDAFEATGMTGTVEHAQLLRDEDFARFAALGLIASVQPEHAMDDRDVADRFWSGRTGRAFAFGSLHRAGVRLRLGSDAPVSPLDPWQAMAAAVWRSRDDRDSWHPEQRIGLDVALAASARTTLASGEPADLVIVERNPFDCDRDRLRDMPVAATLRAGEFTWRAI